jgi:hypothetical protein
VDDDINTLKGFVNRFWVANIAFNEVNLPFPAFRKWFAQSLIFGRVKVSNIQQNDLVPVHQQPASHMKPEKACSTRYEHSHSKHPRRNKIPALSCLRKPRMPPSAIVILTRPPTEVGGYENKACYLGCSLRVES